MQNFKTWCHDSRFDYGVLKSLMSRNTCMQLGAMSKLAKNRIGENLNKILKGASR